MSVLSLGDAIKFEEEKLTMYQWGSGNRKEENYHKQLAEWLKDYKRLLEWENKRLKKEIMYGLCKFIHRDENEEYQPKSPCLNQTTSCLAKLRVCDVSCVVDKVLEGGKE